MSESKRKTSIRVAVGKHKLTLRQFEVFELIIKGYSVKDAAKKLCIEITTVKRHRIAIYAEFGVHSANELLASLGEFKAEITWMPRTK